MGRPRVPLEQRFWKHVLKQDGDQCWLWIGGHNGKGYGTTSLDGTGQKVYAHRVSYYLTYGEFDWNLYVLHKCDNPQCVRPDHLELGTQAKNIMDAIRRGRMRIPTPRKVPKTG